MEDGKSSLCVCIAISFYSPGKHTHSILDAVVSYTSRPLKDRNEKLYFPLEHHLILTKKLKKKKILEIPKTVHLTYFFVRGVFFLKHYHFFKPRGKHNRRSRNKFSKVLFLSNSAFIVRPTDLPPPLWSSWYD